METDKNMDAILHSGFKQYSTQWTLKGNYKVIVTKAAQPLWFKSNL